MAREFRLDDGQATDPVGTVPMPESMRTMSGRFAGDVDDVEDVEDEFEVAEEFVDWEEAAIGDGTTELVPPQASTGAGATST